MASSTHQRGEEAAPQLPLRGRHTKSPEGFGGHVSVWTLAAIIGLILFMMLGSAGLAYVLANMGEERYAAEVQILYDASGADLEQELATQEVLLQSRVVLASAVQSADIDVRDVQEALSVDVLGESQVLQLRLEHDDPETAASLLEAITDRYVTLTADASQERVDASHEVIARRIAETEAALAEVVARRDELALTREEAAGEAGTPPAGAEERNLEAEVIRLQQRLSSLQDRAVAIELDLSSAASARVLDGVYVLDDPVAPRPLQAAAAAALGGAVIAGVGVALFLRPRSDTREAG